MTIDEANKIAKELENINVEMWFIDSRATKAQLRLEYKYRWNEIVNAGFKIRRKRIWSEAHHMKIPQLVVVENKHKDDIAFTNNRSSNAKYRGDCTTRAICFCTGEDYDAIQKEQFEVAKKNGGTWRTTWNWPQVLVKRGFVEFKLVRHVSRFNFLKLIGPMISNGIIATVSSGHVAAIDMEKKKILDTWDSSGGRIKRIFVPNTQTYDYGNALLKNNLI